MAAQINSGIINNESLAYDEQVRVRKWSTPVLSVGNYSVCTPKPSLVISSAEILHIHAKPVDLQKAQWTR